MPKTATMLARVCRGQCLVVTAGPVPELPGRGLERARRGEGHGPASARVKARSGLVEKDDPRRSHQGHRQVKTALHAAGEGEGRPGAHAGQVEQLEQFRAPLTGRPRLDSPVSEEPANKRVSWVELYFDLIFVFAVGQMTHIMTDEPRWSGFGVALGLFIQLWWTWVGFVVLSGAAHPAAAWFITGGLASYLLSTRAVADDRSVRFGGLVRTAAVAVTVCLAFLEPLISATGVLLVTTAWAVAIAAYVTWRFPGRLKGVTADPLSYFHPAPGRPERQPSWPGRQP
jgi:hypothetical protein